MVKPWLPLLSFAIAFMGLGVTLAKHGKPRDGRYNFGATLVVYAVMVYVYYLGGFYDTLLELIRS